MRRRGVLWTLATLAIAAAGCAVPTDGSPTAVATEELPPELQPEVTDAPATTVASVGTEVPIWFYNTQDQVLETVTRTVEQSSVDVEDALRELLMATPTEEEFGNNLITRLVGDPDPEDPDAQPPQLELVGVTSLPEQVNVQIRGEILAQNPARTQLFAQIVFTATDRSLAGSADNVLIQNGSGDNRQVDTESAGVVNRRVRRADYPSLDPDTVQEPADTTTTSRPPPSTRAPTTTGPPDTRNRSLTVPPITIAPTTTGTGTLPREDR